MHDPSLEGAPNVGGGCVRTKRPVAKVVEHQIVGTHVRRARWVAAVDQSVEVARQTGLVEASKGGVSGDDAVQLKVALAAFLWLSKVGTD